MESKAHHLGKNGVSDLYFASFALFHVRNCTCTGMALSHGLVAYFARRGGLFLFLPGFEGILQ